MHRTTIEVRWGELDPYNHVNHAVYSSYLEHGRVAALATLDRAADPGEQIVVVRSDIRFRRPATAGDQLVISTAVTELVGARIGWQQQIARGADTIIEALIESAYIAASGRPARIPPVLRSALDQLR